MHQPNHRGQCTSCIITTAKKATFLPLLVGLSANYWQFLWNFGGHWDKKQATRFGCYRDSDQKFVFIVFNITQWNLRYGNSGNLAIMEHDVLQREKPPQKSQYRITADISRPMHDSLRHGRGLDPSMDWIGLGWVYLRTVWKRLFFCWPYYYWREGETFRNQGGSDWTRALGIACLVD